MSPGQHEVWRRHGAAPPVTALDSCSVELIRQRLASAQRRETPAHMRFKWRHSGTAAVMLLLCEVNGQVSLLLEERNHRLKSHPGDMCFAGGKCEPGESAERTALRETFEELGLPECAVEIVGEMHPVPNQANTLQVHPLVGVVRGPLDLRLNRAEVHRAVVLPLAHFYNPAVRSLVSFRSWGLSIPAYTTDKPGLRIWGLTAFVLFEFLCRIAAPASPRL
ncbi:hypothetical protein H4R21_001572 [Coemansia helicoidea]|uniref:Uncharacterized protein n=1 Tax=Coemansia helicoidea TaxID=1286919 RepID=A0ACC1LB42_9FUNG|nr:hypothetical protein H4R21_001572 [Coemansia helicoidea]